MLSHDYSSAGANAHTQPQPLHLLRAHTNGFSAPSAQLPTPQPSHRSSPNRMSSSPSRNPSRSPSRPPFIPIRPEEAEHIWIVTGPAGCGKTTIAKYLQGQLMLPYIEGDDYHSQSNKDKMAQGVPLTDADRWDWLITLREKAVEKLNEPASHEVSEHAGNSSTLSSTTDDHPRKPRGVIVTCSALKHKYRDVIRVACYDNPTIQVHFIYLRASESMLQRRVAARQGHYMKSGMVHSQFENLEAPDQEYDVLSVDVDASPEEVQRRALEVVKAKLAEYEPANDDENAEEGNEPQGEHE